MSISLDPDQAWHIVGPDLVPNNLQRSSADDTCRQMVKGLTLKVLIMTAADDKICDIFPNFRQKWGMILHENRLPADDSCEISCLIGYFWKSGKIWNCRLLQITGGALRVNVLFFYFSSYPGETCDQPRDRAACTNTTTIRTTSTTTETTTSADNSTTATSTSPDNAAGCAANDSRSPGCPPDYSSQSSGSTDNSLESTSTAQQRKFFR